MKEYNSDLHIHSPHSIAVSKKLNLDTMNETATKKGLNILSTGDITQPDWRKYLKENLLHSDGIYSYKNLNFILGTELEDNKSIHHVVLLPDFTSAQHLQDLLDPFVKNITGQWAGRPHVHKSPAEIVEIIEDVGGICGPAHAFTPFKSVFRQGRYNSLEAAYGTAAKKLSFLELGLSADTDLADRIESLSDITFLSNSDAHSEGPGSLGREFNRLKIEEPSFEEIRKACLRRKGRKVVLNVGLEPRLGKYNIMFCRKCRRRVILEINGRSKFQFGLGTSKFDDNFIKYHFTASNQKRDFLKQVEQKKVECPACKSEIKKKGGKKSRKIPRLKLGVSERINAISTWKKPHHPNHRPKYLDIIPLVEMIRKISGLKSTKTKTVKKYYEKIINQLGTEFEILVDIPIEKIEKFEDGKISRIIRAFRERKINFIPGGGGTFGKISLDEI